MPSPRKAPIRVPMPQLKSWRRDQPDWHGRSSIHGAGADIRRLAIAAAGDVQHGHGQAAVCVDLVDEDLQKTYDGNICVVAGDDQGIGTVVDRKGHDGVTARDHTATDT
jgi:hypothetical protein